MSRRGEQHPFTPEPRVPEPWPERDPSPWEWEGAEGPTTASDAPESVVAHPDDIRRVKAHVVRQRRKWRKRGFSIGFGSYEG